MMQGVHTTPSPATHMHTPIMHPALLTSLWTSVVGCIQAAHGGGGGTVAAGGGGGCLGDGGVQNTLHMLLHMLVQYTMPLTRATEQHAAKTGLDKNDGIDTDDGIHATMHAITNSNKAGQCMVDLMMVLAAVGISTYTIHTSEGGVAHRMMKMLDGDGDNGDGDDDGDDDDDGGGGGGGGNDIQQKQQQQQEYCTAGGITNTTGGITNAWLSNDVSMAVALRCMMKLPVAVLDVCLPHDCTTPEVCFGVCVAGGVGGWVGCSYMYMHTTPTCTPPHAHLINTQVVLLRSMFILTGTLPPPITIHPIPTTTTTTQDTHLLLTHVAALADAHNPPAMWPSLVLQRIDTLCTIENDHVGGSTHDETHTKGTPTHHTTHNLHLEALACTLLGMLLQLQRGSPRGAAHADPSTPHLGQELVWATAAGRGLGRMVPWVLGQLLAHPQWPMSDQRGLSRMAGGLRRALGEVGHDGHARGVLSGALSVVAAATGVGVEAIVG